MEPDLKLDWYRNSYFCQRCALAWGDEWSAMCNDRCPGCDWEWTPLYSVDLNLTLDKDDYSYAARRLPSPLWPPAVAQLLQSALEGG